MKKIEKLMNKIENFIYVHLRNQIEAGADTVQIFDSWAGLLPENKIKKFCFEPTKRIVAKVKEAGQTNHMFSERNK